MRRRIPNLRPVTLLTLLRTTLVHRIAMSVTALKRPSRRQRNVAAASKAAMPGFVEPCDPTLQEQAPTGDNWVYEIKIDGYRAQVHLYDGRVTIYSRRGYDWTEQFAPIAKAASELKVREAIIDGEVTVLGKTGFPDFQALRGELGNRESTRLLYHAFDLLYLNGRDLRRAPLLKRKKALKSILKKSPAALAYVDFLEADGSRVLEQACRMGLEGSWQNVLTRRTDRGVRRAG
jgi:bifunctional non-homologous end joining protein LigD